MTKTDQKEHLLALMVRRLDSYHAAHGTNDHHLSKSAGRGTEACRSIRRMHMPRHDNLEALTAVMGVTATEFADPNPGRRMRWEREGYIPGMSPAGEPISVISAEDRDDLGELGRAIAAHGEMAGVEIDIKTAIVLALGLWEDLRATPNTAEVRAAVIELMAKHAVREFSASGGSPGDKTAADA